MTNNLEIIISDRGESYFCEVFTNKSFLLDFMAAPYIFHATWDLRVFSYTNNEHISLNFISILFT